MNKPEATVFVVDDNPSFRRAIKRLIGSVGLQVSRSGPPTSSWKASFRT